MAKKPTTVQLDAALRAYGEAQFDAGEWRRDEADEPYKKVHARVERAEARLRKLIGLPPRDGISELAATLDPERARIRARKV